MTTITVGGITQELENYTGGLVHTREYRHQLVTLAVRDASDEQNYVTTCVHDLPSSENAEHFQAVDLYSFSATDGTQIQLTIKTPADSQEAWYSVERVVVTHFSIKTDIVRSSESIPLNYAYTKEPLDDTLTHYSDQIPDWLNEIAKRTCNQQRDDFGR